jgi:hypothetical protein
MESPENIRGQTADERWFEATGLNFKTQGCSKRGRVRRRGRSRRSQRRRKGQKRRRQKRRRLRLSHLLHHYPGQSTSLRIL